MKLKGHYGLDAPGIIRSFGLTGAVLIVVGIGFGYMPSHFSVTPLLLYWFCLIAGCLCMLNSFLMIFSSLFGKERELTSFVNNIKLNGNEQLLDVGCGNGMLLNLAAKRLTTGQITGVDLWNPEDQSGNCLKKATANSVTEGTSRKVKFVTGDMRRLPFPDSSFDIVLSSLALHNIMKPDERKKALREIARVVKPNGEIYLLDFIYTNDYQETLQELGWSMITRSRPYFRMFPPVRIVHAQQKT